MGWKQGMVSLLKVYDGQPQCVHGSLSPLAQGTGGLAGDGRELLFQMPIQPKILTKMPGYNPTIAAFFYSICSIWAGLLDLSYFARAAKLEKTRAVGIGYSLSLRVEPGLEKNGLDVPADRKGTDPQSSRQGPRWKNPGPAVPAPGSLCESTRSLRAHLMARGYMI